MGYLLVVLFKAVLVVVGLASTDTIIVGAVLAHIQGHLGNFFQIAVNGAGVTGPAWDIIVDEHFPLNASKGIAHGTGAYLYLVRVDLKHPSGALGHQRSKGLPNGLARRLDKWRVKELRHINGE